MSTTNEPGPFGKLDDIPPRPDPPTHIGPYRILQILGEGGMGVVYEAEQTEPVRRRVALKVIKQGLHDDQVEARFGAERQALAVMDHAHIARVFDGGSTADGRSFFAMELVRGMQFITYCDVNKLQIHERLQLFSRVCDAVQHAHQKGVIHRDLKPGNILVSEQDRRPIPKIIDFGIAKAVGRQLTDHAIVTQQGGTIGTPAYMSPEQADGSGLDVDTRADIYSLGVILHELLTGRLPLDPAGMTAAEFMAKLVMRDTTPRTPSAALGDLDREGAAQVAGFRHTDPPGLRRDLRGDLDWIVLRAIERDRNRRYQTANDLSADIARHLADEPVSAGPPGAWYRFGKFVRRNRVAVGAGSIVMVSVMLGVAATTTALTRARRAEAVAEQEAQAALQVSNFLVGLFRGANPRTALGDPATAEDLLNQGARTVREELAGQPEVQARMLHAIGTVYEALGQYEESQRTIEEALQLLEQTVGSEEAAVARSLNALGNVLRVQGDYARAETELSRAAEIYDRLPSLPRARGDVANNLGLLYLETGQFGRAESLLVGAARSYEEAFGPRDTLLATALSNLGTVYLSQGLLSKAESTLSRSLSIRRERLPPNHPDLADVLNNLGATYWFLGAYERAEPLYRQTLEIYEGSLGPDNVSTGSALNNLGETYWKMGDMVQAESFLRRALDTKIRAVGPGHLTVSSTLTTLANVLRDGGSSTEADALYRRALTIRERGLGPNSPAVAEVLREHAALLTQTGRNTEADRLSARADSIDGN